MLGIPASIIFIKHFLCKHFVRKYVIPGLSFYLTNKNITPLDAKYKHFSLVFTKLIIHVIKQYESIAEKSFRLSSYFM